MQESGLATPNLHPFPALFIRSIEITGTRKMEPTSKYLTKSYLKAANRHLRLETQQDCKKMEPVGIMFRNLRAGCIWENSAHCSIPERQAIQTTTSTTTNLNLHP